MFDPLIPAELHDLCSLGKIEDEFDCFGHKIRIGILWENEMREIMKECNGLDALARSSMMKYLILQKAIISIDGVGYQEPDKTPVLRAILNTLSTNVTKVIYNRYLDLVQANDIQFEAKLREIESKLNPLSGAGTGESSGALDSKTHEIPSTKQ